MKMILYIRANQLQQCKFEFVLKGLREIVFETVIRNSVYQSTRTEIQLR